MRFEEIRNSFAPNLFFLIAILYLAYSGLTISKAITLQNEVIASFMTSLSEKDVLFALLDSLKIIFYQAILPLLPFLFLAGFGFLVIFLLREKTNIKFLIGIQILFLLLAFVLTRLIAIVFVYIGIFVASLFLIRLSEEKKTNFSTGNSIASKGLGWINIFLALGFFLSLYINFQAYQQIVVQENMNLVKGFIPDTEQLQEAQLEILNNTADNIKLTMANKCQEAVNQTGCMAFYEIFADEIESYKQQTAEQLKAQEGTTDELVEEYIQKSFPMMEQITKATPLFLAVTLFALLEILKPFVSIAFGFIYSAVKKFI